MYNLSGTSFVVDVGMYLFIGKVQSREGVFSSEQRYHRGWGVPGTKGRY